MNKKFLKSGLCVVLSLFTALGVSGCGGNNDPDPDDTTKTYDNSTRPLTMAIGAIDGNFNPFFYTTQNDGTVASLTQVSLLSTDVSGNPYCGEDVPTVAKDYTITEAADSSTTTYRFLIKNGMKFSDGYDLTVMDVLFSLYVNLDMAYTGSATLYSTDIQGLKAYRSQDPTMSDSSELDYSSTFTTAGQERIDAIIAACSGTGTKTQQVLDDIETVKKLFLEEITSDWTTVESNFSSSYTEDSFEYNFGEGEAWKYYLLNEGIISVLTGLNDNGATVQLKDENGKYYTTLDKYGTNTDPTDYEGEIEAAVNNSSLIKAYTDEGATYDEAVEYVKRDAAIQIVYDDKTSLDSGIVEILSYWATGDTALEQFAGEEMTAYYNDLKDANGGTLKVESIKGITVERVTSWTDDDGNTIGLDGEYDVLQIVINKIDPKAIYNFAVTVCPMHYYSDKEHYDEAMADYNTYLTTKDGSDITHFGVELADSTWFSDVLQDSEKNRNPVGAGSYATSNQNGGTGTASTFYTNKYVYYIRNEYFYTMGEGIDNAKIKYVQYREMGDDKIISALAAKEVDYGMPSATDKNAAILKQYSSYLDYTTALYDTSGYGYVGINPKFVPDYQVRVAIMKAMDTASIVKDYYTKYYASTIYRPMSKTSWAYDNSWTEYYAYTENTSDIIALLEDAGWYDTDGNGIREKNGEELKLTFTIAGESKDHPAYNMFLAAETLLEKCGFDITVSTNINALKELASGNLAVWAAAWTSSVDPDMYQVYHKDSTASSVKNWNYTNILDNPNEWTYEDNIIQYLSVVIDLARSVNDQTTRKAYYAEALDLVMDLAVELPTYQRKDNEVFNFTVIDKSTCTAKPSTYVSLIDRIWEVDYL